MSSEIGQFFTLEELTKSEKAEKLKLDNRPNTAISINLELLVWHILDPIRKLWGGPIGVRSGYRSEAVNTAVGGSNHSDHIMGMAADIYVPNGDNAKNKELYCVIKRASIPLQAADLRAGKEWQHMGACVAGYRHLYAEEAVHHLEAKQIREMESGI